MKWQECFPRKRERWCKPEFAVDAGSTAEQIVMHAQNEHADLIVMGRARHEDFSLQGGPGVTQKVICAAPCPVLSVPEAWKRLKNFWRFGAARRVICITAHQCHAIANYKRRIWMRERNGGMETSAKRPASTDVENAAGFFDAEGSETALPQRTATFSAPAEFRASERACPCEDDST